MKSSLAMRTIPSRMVTAVLVVVGLAVFANGCDGGHEGDRCVPTSLRSSDECGTGLACQQIGTCGESYCCPGDPTKSSHPYCNGSGFASCPVADASADAPTDAPAVDTGTD